MFDVVDVIFDLPGYISGYGVSPDSKYIHVNIHPWPKHAMFSNPLHPPPVGLCRERIVIDLSRMEVVGRSLPNQRVFIPSDPDYCEAAPVQVSPYSLFFIEH